MKPINPPVAVASFTPSIELETDRFLTLKDVLHHVGLGKTTTYRLIKEGKFPQQIRIDGCRSVLFSLRDIQQWQEDQKRGGAK